MGPLIVGDVDPDDIDVVSLEDNGALRAYRAAGGVIDFCVIHVASTVEPVQAHRVAAATMIVEASQRLTELLGQMGGEHRVSYAIDAARATFEPITPQQFVGPFYSWSTAQLTSSWVDGVRHGIQPNGPITNGYADAFSDPPYPLRATIERASAWFRAINDGTFGGLDQKLTVCRWSTDWSTYFDAGHEWWGSHCWTVQAHGSQLVTAIGASSTD